MVLGIESSQHGVGLEILSRKRVSDSRIELESSIQADNNSQTLTYCLPHTSDLGLIHIHIYDRRLYILWVSVRLSSQPMVTAGNILGCTYFRTSLPQKEKQYDLASFCRVRQSFPLLVYSKSKILKSPTKGLMMTFMMQRSSDGRERITGLNP